MSLSRRRNNTKSYTRPLDRKSAVLLLSGRTRTHVPSIDSPRFWYSVGGFEHMSPRKIVHGFATQWGDSNTCPLDRQSTVLLLSGGTRTHVPSIDSPRFWYSVGGFEHTSPPIDSPRFCYSVGGIEHMSTR